MSDKKWNKGTNCKLARDFVCGEVTFREGDLAWVFDVGDNTVTVLTKTPDKVNPERALKKVVVPLADASSVIKLTTGKPRKDFSTIFVTKEDVAALAASKME